MNSWPRSFWLWLPGQQQCYQMPCSDFYAFNLCLCSLLNAGVIHQDPQVSCKLQQVCDLGTPWLAFRSYFTWILKHIPNMCSFIPNIVTFQDWNTALAKTILHALHAGGFILRFITIQLSALSCLDALLLVAYTSHLFQISKLQFCLQTQWGGGR